jgi:hypothetical protein
MLGIIVNLATSLFASIVVGLVFYRMGKREHKREVREQAQGTKWLWIFFVGFLCAAVLVAACKCKLPLSA